MMTLVFESTSAFGLEIQHLELTDGTELVLATMPKAKTAAFRYVVRSGATSDPASKAGLAHLVEHLIFRGTYCSPRHAMDHQARTSGAYMNAYTSPDETVYIVNAPQDTFLPIMGMLFEAVTGPALSLAPIAPEKGVVETEQLLNDGKSLLWVADKFLFPDASPGIIGTPASRRGITTDDVIDFFGTHYVPKNSAIIVAGDFDPSTIREQLERTSRLAPSTDILERPKENPNLPTRNRARAPFNASMVGYRLEKRDAPHCNAMAEWLHFRLLEARSSPAGIFVYCTPLRHQDFIFAVVTSRRLGDTLSVLEDTFQSLIEQPMTRKEARTLSERAQRARQALRHDPQALADALVEIMTRPPQARYAPPESLLRSASLKPGVLSDIAHRTFRSDHRLVLELTPF